MFLNCDFSLSQSALVPELKCCDYLTAVSVVHTDSVK